MSMYDTPLQNIEDICKSCPHLKKVLKNNLEGINLGIFREACRTCKSFGNNEGIYKGDVVLSALGYNKPKNKFNPKGKTATAFKRYGHAVKQLREQKKSIREIANILGISTNTVNKITKSFEKKEN